MNRTDFVVAKDGFLDGVWKAAGEKIGLTEKQAEHLLISGQIARPAAPADPAQPEAVADAPAAKPAKK